MSTDSLDAGIPVLTEIIPAGVPAAGVPEAIPAPEIPVLRAAIPAIAPAAAVLPPLKPALPAVDVEQLAAQVQERVMTQMMMRIDQMLELRVRDCLADVMQASVDRLARELREGLQQSIREGVGRALAQEIAELKQPKI
ncbi:hypothetical protein [Noviherbaspirillum aridicola]|uniref:DUF2486 family protein n=1 Tax=Noviherbaspirillum aridicola TaxID=2849687 RepID=A0ABQ4Q4V2_9BURK|nr:hypothetical protein [Noviherbaspirillum aridicola]GIZ52027.1 hypothetical protein NCCP691_20410 [Noviherbaspirillum aridicola]